MHAIEKILARASGQKSVSASQNIMAKVDIAEINDLYLQTLVSFKEFGGEKVWDPDRVAFVFDHYSPAPTINAAYNHRKMREFAVEQGIGKVFDINSGVCHQVLVEAGLVWPGMVLVATDSHTTTHGAFGAFGTGLGATDLASVLISGEIWLRVPQIMNIRIEGEVGQGVLPKDVILHIVGQIRADGAIYKSIEFTGSYVDSLDIAGRMVLCNLAVEMGAKSAYIQPNEQVIDFVTSRTDVSFEIFETDPGFEYCESILFEVSDLTAQLALPSSVDNVISLNRLKDTVKIDQCFIGTCTGGRETDLHEAANVLRGKEIAAQTRLVIIPASRQVLQNCIEDGTIGTLVAAGATVTSPGCGPCLGTHAGLLTAGERCVTTANRNFPGRMGDKDSEIYLASPRIVALAALHGYLDPRMA